VKERTREDLRGLITELVAVDENGRDQLSLLEQPDVQKLKSVFSHYSMDYGDTVDKVMRCALNLRMDTVVGAPPPVLSRHSHEVSLVNTRSATQAASARTSSDGRVKWINRGGLACIQCRGQQSSQMLCAGPCRGAGWEDAGAGHLSG
jgi:hypothetical protein